MIRHTIFFRVKPEVTQQEIDYAFQLILKIKQHMKLF